MRILYEAKHCIVCDKRLSHECVCTYWSHPTKYIALLCPYMYLPFGRVVEFTASDKVAVDRALNLTIVFCIFSGMQQTTVADKLV